MNVGSDITKERSKVTGAISQNISERPECVAILVLHKASLLSFGSLAEAFLAANKNSDRKLYDVFVIAPKASNNLGQIGLRIGSTELPNYNNKFDLVLVCGGYGDASHLELDSLAWLRRQRSLGAKIGGIGDAVISLSKHGLINSEFAAYHWNILRSFEETMYTRGLKPKLYEASEKSISSMGGIAALDLALALISEKHGKQLSASISDLFAYGRIRGPLEDADRFVRCRVGTTSSIIESTVRLMHQNIEEPLTQEELADAACISLRQLQRAFRNHLSDSPSAYYKRLRLIEASRLLTQGGYSVTHITYACGFKSQSHFAKVFRDKYGVTPSEYAML